jgi:hypothetical protein
MLFKDLVEMVHSCDHVKLYAVDHEHPGFFTGFVSNPHMKNKDGRNVPYIDLHPYVGLLSLDIDAPLVGHTPGDITYNSKSDVLYNGFRFQGAYATTDFNYHKLQVMQLIKQVQRATGESPTRLNEYFKIAKSL